MNTRLPTRRFLFAPDARFDLLKATAKKLVTVAGYTTSDGRVIPAHQKMVHYDPDKTFAAVASGKGSHSQKKAHAKLSGKGWWQSMSLNDQAIAIMALATDLQDAASQSAAVSGWKKVALQGKNPTPGQWAAFMAQPKLKQGELLALVQEQVGVGHLVSPALPVSPDKAAALEEQAATAPPPEAPAPAATLPAPPKITPELMAAIGAKAWEHPQTGEVRYYINGLADLYGLKTDHYKTGNIASATLDGQKISNSHAKDLLWALNGKAWLTADGMLTLQGIGESVKAKLRAAIAGKLLTAHQALTSQAAASTPPATEQPIAAEPPPPPDPHADAQAALAAMASGPHYQKVALAKLKGDKAWQAKTPPEQHAQAMALYKELQSAASLSAALSTAKKALIAGKVPTKAQYDAIQTASPDAVGKLHAAVSEHLTPSQYSDLMAAAQAKHYGGAPATPGNTPPANASVPKAKVKAKPDPKEGPAWTGELAAAVVTLKAGLLISGSQHLAILKLSEGDKSKLIAEVDAAAGKGAFLAGLEKYYLASGEAAQKAKAADAEYAKQAKAAVMPAPADNAPKEGDTKQGADGLLVLKDGRWQKVNGDKPTPIAKPGIQAMDGWQKVGGQQGSNEGGRYRDPAGVEWYVKFPQNPDAARAEVLAAKLYTLAGASAQDCKFVTRNGNLAIATRWVDLQKVAPKDMSKLDGVREFFAVDAWLGNHDVVGEDFSNIQKGADGKAHRVDAGGSLMFRAQGQQKAFGPSVDAIDSMRAPKYGNNHAVFGGMTKAEIAASVKHVLAVPDADIRLFCKKFGPGTEADRAKLADTLIQRKADLRQRYPEAVDAPVYRVPSKPDFSNWHGPGKGLSSKAALNQQNDELAAQIHALGTAHDKAALQALKYQPIQEDGSPSGAVQPIGKHPSQHIKAYWQDVQQALETPHVSSAKQAKQQALKNKALQGGGIDDVATLKDSALSIGRYGVLGNIGLQDVAAMLPDKEVSFKSSPGLHAALYADQKASLATLPSLQKSAVKDYTGSKYHEVNQALVSGAPNDAAKNAATGVESAAHALPAGLVLSRKITPKLDTVTGKIFDTDAFLKKLQEAGEGVVLKEFALCSTSLKSDVWSGSIHLRITCADGVRGLYVGRGPTGGGHSKHPNEQEVILPEGTKYIVKKIHKKGEHFTDEHGAWGAHYSTVVELLALPN